MSLSNKIYELRKENNLSFICIIAAVVLLVLLFRSPVFNPGSLYNNDRLIVKEEDSYHNGGFTRSPLTEDGQMDFSFDNFSGSITIHIFQIDEESSFHYSWNLIVNKGQFKIVLVSTENSEIIETMCEGTGNGENQILLTPGEYRIKLIGNGAEANGQLVLGSLNNQ